MSLMNKSRKWLLILIVVIVLISCVSVIFMVDINKGKNGSESSSVDSASTKKYNVTFYSNDGMILKTDSITKNASAIPPVAPSMKYGTVFKSWDTDFSEITNDLEIHPVCEEVKNKPNVIAVQGRYTKKDSTVVVPIQLCGDVCVAGLDITVRYDKELLQLKAVTEDAGVVFNDATPGIVKLNYVSTKNTVGDVDICNLKFHVNATEGEIPITLGIDGIYAFKDEGKSDKLYIPKSTVVDGKVYVVK